VSNELIEDFIKRFGDVLPDPTHYPQSFAYYVKLFKHLRKIK